ncbi:hypothetical protein C1N76_13330 [Geobacillus thermoleovorans]|uniref:Uncharacterized protein n=1 Tax=Geobacillus thermoleovorans TaxID=33941 RepID=A0A2Z3NBP8_GEOTH|nr:hypothetical protein C1N76_13330 [Geobacillus thermoleovorans]
MPELRSRTRSGRERRPNYFAGRASFAVFVRQSNRGTHGDGLVHSLPWGGCSQESPTSKR